MSGILSGVLGLVFALTLFRFLRPKKNKIYFNCHENKLQIERDSVSVNKNIEFFRQEMEQFYVTRTHNGIALKVILNTPQGQVHKMVVDSLKSAGDAKYLEQEIEKYYGIPNSKVSNEIQ